MSFNYYVAKKALGSISYTVITPGYISEGAAKSCCDAFSRGLGHKFTFEVWTADKVSNYVAKRKAENETRKG